MNWIVLGLTLGLLAQVACDSGPPRTPDAGDGVVAAAFPGLSPGSVEVVQNSAPVVVRRVWYHPVGLDFWGGADVWVMEDFLPGPEDAQDERRSP